MVYLKVFGMVTLHSIYTKLHRMIGKHWLTEEAALKLLATFALHLLCIVTPSTRLLVRYSSPPFNIHTYFSSIKSLVDNSLCVVLVLVNSNGTYHFLTHWGRVTHICVGKLTISGSHNGLSPGRRQSIIWTNVGILLIWHLGTNFSKILIKIYTFSLKKMHLKMSSGKCRPFCLGLNVL